MSLKISDVIIANPPWYYFDDCSEMRIGIRAGSRWPFTIRYKEDIKVRYRPFPFLMNHAASYLKANGIKVAVIDSITLGHTYKLFFDLITRSTASYIVLETSSASIKNDLRIAYQLHRTHYRKVILVGTHATVFAEKLIKKNYIFAVIKGEYELNLLDLIKNPQSRIYDYKLVKNLDDLPFPNRDYESIFLYREKTHNDTPFQVSMMSSRGCPFNCIFCQWPPVMYKNKYRERSIDNIHAEIEYIKKIIGQQAFLYFDDDTFNLNSKRTLEIADMISDSGLKWSAMCRIDTLSKEDWSHLKKCGMTCVNIGIETSSPDLMANINKNLDIQKAEENVHHLNDIGMHVHCTFLWGIPGETKEHIFETTQLYNRIKVQSKQEAKAQPLPGTPWWNSLPENERSRSFDGYKTLDETRSKHKLK